MGGTDEFDDEFDDDFGGIDDAALIQAAEQVEHQVLIQSSLPASSSNNATPPDAFRGLLEGAFDDDDEDSFGEGGDAPRHNRPLNTHNRHHQQQQARPRWAAPSKGPLRQTTLTGGPLRENVRPQLSQSRQGNSSSSSSTPRQGNNNSNMTRHNYQLVEDLAQEPPTHHKLDLEAAKTWVYPTNVSLREYQFNIVQRALFNNLLVALPTGLGKTFIAAAVMLNWYRWAPDSQIAFLAPTKPLVIQQIDACYNLAGIPRSQTALLTGQVPARVRAELWNEKRLFFSTPQTMQNDLARGLADPKRIVCVVIDEAHRATGAYSYVEVVKFIRRFNNSFRVLALTATPGSKVETVQEVIDSLGISRVEIRTEESLDIRQYVHQKIIEPVVIEWSPEIKELRDLFVATTKPLLDELKSKGACRLTDAEKLSTFTMLSAKTEWLRSPAGRNANPGHKGQILGLFGVLCSLAHPLTLLLFHGINTFYNAMIPVSQELEKGSGKLKARVIGNPNYKKLMSRAKEMIASPTFSEHPKLDYLVGAVLRHFLEKADSDYGETRVMIFSSFRGSAEEIVNTLKKHQPAIKPHIFVGQADSKDGTSGMNQKTQKEVIQQFIAGTYNTLVATSIGEEGLDIGNVDLIICYDSNKSPIRMLQRIGRAGRKREGNILVLLTKGKEETNWSQANDNYLFIQRSIAQGDKYNFHNDQSPRILPHTIQPVVEKREIVPPVEPPSPQKVRGKKKLPPKKFYMPDGVSTGFTKASRIGKPQNAQALSSENEDEGDEEEEEEEDVGQVNSEMYNLAYNYPDRSSTEGLLDEDQKEELHTNYMCILGEEGDVTVPMPSMDKFPECQRTLTATHTVGHGEATKSLVRMLNRMREYQFSEDKLERLKKGFREEDVLGGVEVTPPPPSTTTTTTTAMMTKVPGNKAFKPPTRLAAAPPASTSTSTPKQRFIPKPKFGANSANKTPIAKKLKLDDDVDSLSSSGVGYDDCDDSDVIDITSTAENENENEGFGGGVISSSPLALASVTSTLDGDHGDNDDEDVDMLDVNTTPTTTTKTKTTTTSTTRKRNIHLDSDSDDLLDVNALLRQPTPRGKKESENSRRLSMATGVPSSASTVVHNDRARKRRIVDSDDEEEDEEDEDEDDEEEDEL
ncbi:hypothetical protein DFH27DRAFT_518562 [Peziza echinospora]|nr:hypothetical protein DFH27DRAFT_518562 [Peziza echinospora]